mgnify:FL=1
MYGLCSVELMGVSSTRLGHPVLTAHTFGRSTLCDSQWGDKEAQVRGPRVSDPGGPGCFGWT